MRTENSEEQMRKWDPAERQDRVKDENSVEISSINKLVFLSAFYQELKDNRCGGSSNAKPREREKRKRRERERERERERGRERERDRDRDSCI